MGTPSTARLVPHLSPPKPPPIKPPGTQSVHNVVLGDILIKTWYGSYYPEELVGKDIYKLYVCPWCFKYTRDAIPYSGHIVRPQSLLWSDVFALVD